MTVDNIIEASNMFGAISGCSECIWRDKQNHKCKLGQEQFFPYCDWELPEK